MIPERLKTPSELVEMHDAQKIAAKYKLQKLNAITKSLEQCKECVEGDGDVYIVSKEQNIGCPVHGQER